MTTGTKCCEHHREGLPYCVDCEMESDQLREKLHSKLAETEQAGETLESKLAGAEIALEQARAEIERKDKLIEQMVGALNHCKSTFEDYVEIHKAKMPVVTIGPIPPKWGDMQRKIARNQEAFDLCNAALSAAERGEV